MAERQLLADRLAVKEAAAAAIRQRRLASDARDTDGAEMALFSSDADELRAAVIDAEARVVASGRSQRVSSGGPAPHHHRLGRGQRDGAVPEWAARGAGAADLGAAGAGSAGRVRRVTRTNLDLQSAPRAVPGQVATAKSFS